MNTNIVSPGTCLSAGSRFATKLHAIGAAQYKVDDFIQGRMPEFERHIAEYFVPKATDLGSLPPEILKVLEGWQKFYQDFFEVDVDLTTIRIPAKQAGFDRLILIVRGIRLNRVWNIHEELKIPRWQWWSGSLEKAIQASERGSVKTTYALWVRDRQEADEELRNLSAERIANQKINTESLLERLVHGLKYFDETKNHLDVQYVTLCASSRYADGGVPEVCRDGNGHLHVDGSHPTDRCLLVRARQAVR